MMLRKVAAAAAPRLRLRQLDLQQPIRRFWGRLRPISTVQAPLAAPHSSPTDSSPFPFKKRAAMARRIPPVKPHDFSDSEPDEEESVEEEAEAEAEDEDEETEAEEGEDKAPEVLGWWIERKPDCESDSDLAMEDQLKQVK